MSLKFKGGARLQRGRGIGGILRALKSVFSPIVRSIGKTVVKAAKSNTGKLIGNKIKEQAIDSALNLTSNALRGNDLESSLQNELDNAKETAAQTLDQIRSNRKRKAVTGNGVGVIHKKSRLQKRKANRKVDNFVNKTIATRPPIRKHIFNI